MDLVLTLNNDALFYESTESLSGVRTFIISLLIVKTLIIGVFKDLKTPGDVNNNYRGTAKVIIDVTKSFLNPGRHLLRASKCFRPWHVCGGRYCQSPQVRPSHL